MARFTDKEKVTVGSAKMQAEAAHNAAIDSVGGALKTLFAGLGRSFRRGAIANQLRQLDDRLLADIGLQRWQIESVATQAAAGATTSASEAIRALFASISGAFANWRHRRAAYRELMALDDRMLQDIGMSRQEIPAVIASIGRPESHEDAPSFSTMRLRNRGRGVAKARNGLDNRKLDDLGMVRGNIEIVAETLALRSLSPINRNGKLPHAA